MVWEIALGIVLGFFLIPVAIVALAAAVQVTITVGRVLLVLAGIGIVLGILVGMVMSGWVLLGFCTAGSPAVCAERAGAWLGDFSFLSKSLVYTGMLAHIGIFALLTAVATQRVGMLLEPSLIRYEQWLQEADLPSRWLLPMIAFLAIEVFFVFTQNRMDTGLVLLLGALGALAGMILEYRRWAAGKVWWVRWLPTLLLAAALFAIWASFEPVEAISAGVVVAILWMVARYVYGGGQTESDTNQS